MAGAGRGRKAWEGRLSGGTDRRVEEYTSSVDYDRRLWPEDIAGSRAHAAMLGEVGLLSTDEQRALDEGLRAVAAELGRGEFRFDPADEDIHMAVERRLVELIGEPGEKLHTARSRNDQVATDLRLWVRRACAELMLAAATLQEALLRRAREHRTTLLPGYTHLQRAQVVSLAHHLLAYVEMLDRDVGRFADARDRCDVLPLGSGALAATTLPVDRHAVAERLGFGRVSANSLDAVGDRDFAVETVAACALCLIHASRLSEELVLWTTAEFGFAELPDTHATGSSLMPQKKNPDVLELARARTGRVDGALVALLTSLKALPLAYNRDLQEDQQPLFDAVDTTLGTLTMLGDVVGVVRFDTTAMRRAASDPLLIATDLVDHLVVRGVPFREAHRIVGRAVASTLARGGRLSDIDAAGWASLDPRFGDDVTDLFDPARSLRRREVEGGPGPRTVARQLRRSAAAAARTRRRAAALIDHDRTACGIHADSAAPAPPGP